MRRVRHHQSRLHWQLHVPLGLTAGVAVSVLAARAGVSPRRQGLGVGNAPRDLVYGLAAALPVAAVVGTASRSGKLRELQNSATGSMTTRRRVYELLVRIPFGTALPEELIFRGALLGLLSRRFRPAVAAGICSAIFGLWHIVPTLSRMKEDSSLAGQPVAFRIAYVAMMVGATGVAGLLLAWLRCVSGSIAAPWLVHSAANGAGLAATWSRRALPAREATSDRLPRGCTRDDDPS
jgi:membrane protease YdiL (CAAX protease family)